jgi:uncharacterized membrane protein HdeD (DUF308 family)
VFLAFLALHVLAGITAVLTGATAALARKGSHRHIRAGRWYYTAISVVFGTAAALSVMRWARDYQLFIIGAVAFAAATVGFLHRRLHRPGDTGHIAGMGISYVAMLTAFYVDNGPHLPLWDRLPTLTFWLLPSAIGAPIITRAITRARRTSGSPAPSAGQQPPDPSRPGSRPGPESGGSSYAGPALWSPHADLPDQAVRRKKLEDGVDQDV